MYSILSANVMTSSEFFYFLSFKICGLFAASHVVTEVQCEILNTGEHKFQED